MPYDIDQIHNLDAELDALTTPTTAQVFARSRDYNPDVVAASAASRAINGGAGGGGGSGTPRLIGPFPFAFDTPGLVDGVEFYTPTVGDLLLGAVFFTSTSWAGGLIAAADMGTFVGTDTGLFRVTGVSSNGFSLDFESTINGEIAILSPGLGEYGQMVLFTTDDPLKVVVTVDGKQGSQDPGSTQGEAAIYLIVATPVEP